MINIQEVLERDLTPRQRDAATDPSKEVLCLACAGSGKSRTLAYRVARLIAEGEAPSSIVAFTFTDKAAESIKRQVAKALNATGLDPKVLGAMYIGTIHSYCREVLCRMDARYRQFDVLDDNKLKLYLLSRYYDDLHLYRLESSRSSRQFRTISEVSDAWKTMNDEMIYTADLVAHDPILGDTLRNLSDKLDEDEFIDFSLMIRQVVEALSRNEPRALRAIEGLKHLMVDEYQDVNPSQEWLVRELHRHSSTLFVVGDDDQAIYSWRGADVRNIITFQNRYSECSPHTLSHNFRSTPAIVEAADNFVAAELGATRLTKNPEASEPEGPRDFRKLWFSTRDEEAEWVARRIESLLGTAYMYMDKDGEIKTRDLCLGDFAILMRSTRGTNPPPRHSAFTQSLDSRGINYTLESGGGVFDIPEVAALRETFKLLHDRSPARPIAEAHFRRWVLPNFPHADFESFARVMADWGGQIHAPSGDGSPRRRVYPQELVHELLNSFRLAQSEFNPEVMRNLGVFSRIIQDVEAVYLSVDSGTRFREIIHFLDRVAETGYDTSTKDVVFRPDTVTVSTVHKAKGLEFPVVFVVDVVQARFPRNRSSYSGWLPQEILQTALDRGAYQSTHYEEARLFYTALTRAERYLYVTGASRLPDLKEDKRPSRFSQRLDHPEISNDPYGLPEGLVPHDRVSRIDKNVVPTTYSDIKYYLRCPRDYQLRKCFGFSPPIKEMLGFGQSVHTIVSKLHEEFSSGVPGVDDVQRISLDTFHLKHVPRSGDPESRPGPYENALNRARTIAETYVERYAEDFSQNRQVEARFEIPLEQSVISGSIDLLLKEDERGNILDATVIDFKAMEGGDEPIESEKLYWTELALQVQLYAYAAQEVLGENARTGAVHLLKDNNRVEVPVTDEAIEAAIKNVEWAVERILADDYPMRPHRTKCEQCDFKALCSKVPGEFRTDYTPPEIHIPGTDRVQSVRAFSEFDAGT